MTRKIRQKKKEPLNILAFVPFVPLEIGRADQHRYSDNVIVICPDPARKGLPVIPLKRDAGEFVIFEYIRFSLLDFCSLLE